MSWWLFLKLSKEKLLGSDRAYITSGLLLVVSAITH